MNDDEKDLQYASIGIASVGFAVAGLALGMIARRPGIGAVLGAAVGLFWRCRALASRVRS
ncbi:hypothetical protein EDF24_0896 [Curtobacterium sp. PhB130]|uniref:hypothetical protein n=1 Tax=unclassified Curtobacterium TaxID=257496 RepID=UPI000F4C00DE|nr:MULTISPECIES: hypothetical protein [unclassified Curtobacterium]ROS78126.1 hypothetical protein EDF24_0896 [Curtobacterium sp. PhB130]TCK65557.1 hypothetical protein EDF27_0297 [Curtobacterium sp. PhB136]